ncbi:uncharacterized protein LOC103855973 [Brassica rapa]|uniref:RING-type domain-containing protein n=1 Tax=Brassica napus TaxID=3708 RepID=A0ABQ8DPZ8_BRANA|nr:uncharacterized protein LOC103855973 [Brassica rapa]XP_013716538.2 uncharacterized protein LOC106420228 [Brassica napus]XP_022567033.2 uncharacterized protein LOC106420228 [Brassica napus]KAH0931421.1 hypothetical protein HID58_008538 [Brassica napus]
MSSSIQIVVETQVEALSLKDQDEKKIEIVSNELSFGNHGGCCAICLDTIPLQETAMVKGCEHAYCVTCILRWASYKEKPTCPQCKHPFDFLNVHRALDGSVEDFMFEESVCLLLRASWFLPLEAVERVSYNGNDNYDFDIPPEYIPPEYEEEDDEDDLDEFYLHGSNLRLGNRRWGDNGFVRSGRQEARPAQAQHKHHRGGQASGSESGSSSSSREAKEEKTNNSAAATGRRAKRAMKREAANKAAEVVAAAKHEALLVRLGRK